MGFGLQAALRGALPIGARVQAALREAGPVGSYLGAALHEAGRMGQAALDTAQRIRNGPPRPVANDWVVVEREDAQTSSSDDDKRAGRWFDNGGDNGGLFDAEPLNIGYVVAENDGELDEDPEEVRSGGPSWGGESWGPESESDDSFMTAQAKIVAPRRHPTPAPYSCTPQDRAEAGSITVCVDPGCRRERKPPPTPPPTPVGTVNYATPLPSFQIAAALIPSSLSGRVSSSVAGSSSRRPSSAVGPSTRPSSSVASPPTRQSSSSVPTPSPWRASFLARQEAARRGGKATRPASFLGETTEPASKRAKDSPKDSQPDEVQWKRHQPNKVQPKEHQPQPKQHHAMQLRPKENQPKKTQATESQPKKHDLKEVNPRNAEPREHHQKQSQSKQHQPKQHLPKEVQQKKPQPKQTKPKENQAETHQPVSTDHRRTATMPGSWDTRDAPTDAPPKVEFDRADSALKAKIARVKKDFRGQKRKASDGAGKAEEGEGDGGGGKMSAGDA